MRCEINMCNAPASEWIFYGGIATVNADVCNSHVNIIRSEKPHWKIERVPPVKSVPLGGFED